MDVERLMGELHASGFELKFDRHPGQILARAIHADGRCFTAIAPEDAMVKTFLYGKVRMGLQDEARRAA